MAALDSLAAAPGGGAWGLTWRLAYPNPWNRSFKSRRTSPAHGTAAIDRGADLLVRVLEGDEPMAVTDLATAAGLPKSTASRLLSALERRGLVEQDGERGRLRPGPAILRVAERGMLERNFVEYPAGARRALRAERRDDQPVGVPGPRASSTCCRSTAATSSAPASGSAAPSTMSANGKVFLAFGARCARWRTRATRRRRSPTPRCGEPSSRPCGGRFCDVGRRARDRARRDRGAGTRRQWRGGGGTQHHRPDGADDAGADQGAVRDLRGADVERRLGTSMKEHTRHDRRRDSATAV